MFEALVLLFDICLRIMQGTKNVNAICIAKSNNISSFSIGLRSYNSLV